MEDVLLLQKISEGVVSICEQQGIRKLKKLELLVNLNSPITSKVLKEDLSKQIPDIMHKNTEIIVEQDEIGVKAIIKNVEGKK